MATLIEQRSNKFSKKYHLTSLFLFVWQIDMKYEISVSELTPLPNFSLIPLKIENLDPKNKE